MPVASTQRFPEPKDGSTLVLGYSAPESVAPGETAVLHFETAGQDPGIYYVSVEATAGGMSRTFELALAVS